MVSIVIPAYNATTYIDRTLASAVAQTFEHIEIIVINDGSTDDTAHRVESWATRDSRVRMISVPNGGVARARNLGIEAARGEFVAFLDADDLWHRDKIRLQVECLLASPVSLAGCYALTRSIDADDNVISNGPRLVANGYVFARHLSTHLVRNGSCLLVRREIALALGGFDPSYASRGLGGCEDLDFEFKLTAKYLVGVVPHYLVGYRQYPGNMSSNRVRMARAMQATVTAHLAANPGLPRRVRRRAWAKVYEYHIWNNVPERKLITSGFAAAKLALVDMPRALRVFRALGVRSATYVGLRRPRQAEVKEVRPAFLGLPMEPLDTLISDPEVRLIDELASVDAALWNELKPLATHHAGRTFQG